MARAIEITEESLEDLLAYDDLFNDYFNKFLRLPVFGIPLYYNRLTGTFVEVANTVSDERPNSAPYGATDEERERQLEWARYCRLPLFLRSELFREFKLCKLLLRPLEDRLSASNRRGSSKIRGYSRQTEDYASSLSNSGDNSAQYEFDEEEGWQPTYRHSALYRYPRPGSRAFSLPSRVGLGPYADIDVTQKENVDPISLKNALQNHGSRNQNSKQTSPKTTSRSATTRNNESTKERIVREVTFEKDDGNGKSARELSAKSAASQPRSARHSGKLSRRQGTPGVTPKGTKAGYDEEENDVPKELFDNVYGEEEPPTPQGLVDFGKDAESDTQTEADVRDLEEKHKVPLQIMKEQLIGSSEGMEEFSDFLENTAGQDLLSFWLDCEIFKDRMEDYDQLEIIITRNWLYRDIHDKYRLTLTDAARRQIVQAAHDQGLSHTVFIRTQYDVLRRLRTYWLHRFVIHKERSNELSLNSSELYRDDHWLAEQRLMGGEKFSFLPSLSLAASMPVHAEDLMQIAKTANWESISRGGKEMDLRVKSAKPRSAVASRSSSRSLQDKLRFAITMDKNAGGPFGNWLKGRGDYAQGHFQLLFWQEVSDYGVAENRSADRLLRLVHAWNIFNLFISDNSQLSIGLTKEQQHRIHARLQSSRDMVEASVFIPAKQHVVAALETPWIRYLKEDLKTFVDSCTDREESPPSTADNYEVIISDVDDQLQLYVRGPRPWIRRYPPSTASERGTRLRTALSMAESIDEAKRAERRKKMRERREIMEKERKKAVKAAMKRMREAKRKKQGSPTKARPAESEDAEDGKSQAPTQTEGKTYSMSEQRPADTPDKPPTFAEIFKKNKGLVGMFKKYVAESDGKEMKDTLSLYVDIDTYNHTDKEKGKNTQKDKLSNSIFKTYIEAGAKKQVPLSDKVHARMKTEKERPRSPTLREAANHVLPKMEEAFSKFWTSQQELFGDGRNLANMSKAELADLSSLGFKGGKDRRGKHGSRANGAAQPTIEDRVDLSQILHKASQGHMPQQMMYFHKFLVRCSEEDPTNNVGLKNDLFFYCEVQKFKENSHQYADDEMMKRKVRSIHECYLESTTPPSLQINVSSDIAQRAIRGVNKYLQGKEESGTLFEEAQYAVFTALLPYWVRFKRTYKPPEDDKKLPLTKQQRERRKRLEEIQAWRSPLARTVHLPTLPKGATVAAFTFSLCEGIKWRDASETEYADSVHSGDQDISGDGILQEVDGSRVGSVLGNKRHTSMSMQRPHRRSNTMDTEGSKRSTVAAK